MVEIPVFGPKQQFVFPPKDDGIFAYKYSNKFFEYVGQWKNGQKHGKGTFYLGQSSYYEGDFFEGEMTGKGKRIFANGSTYEGEFLDGEFHGKGFFQNPNSCEKFEGYWKNNHYDGEGILTMVDGTKYVGSFVNHQRHGRGKYTDIEGNKYDGDWKFGVIDGKGKMDYANGNYYEGSFVHGLREGTGTMKWAETGLSVTGVWVKDEVIYHPVELILSDLPDFTPGTSLPEIPVTIQGGDGEDGRVLQYTIEIGRIDQAAANKLKNVKPKKQENVPHEPQFFLSSIQQLKKLL